MTDGILNFVGVLIFVGSVMAVGLIILWFTIRSFSLSDWADQHQPYCEEQGPTEAQSGEVLTLSDDDKALENEVADALQSSRR